MARSLLEYTEDANKMKQSAERLRGAMARRRRKEGSGSSAGESDARAAGEGGR